MRLFLKAIFLLVWATSLAPARAADLPSGPYPGYAGSTLFSWTGFYVGYNLGAGWNTQRASSAFAGDWNTTNIGFVGGFQGGYNLQFKSFVIGIEADADYLSESRSLTSAPGPANIIRPTGQWNWTASAAVRLGYAFDNLLVFSKLGYGWVTQTLALGSLPALTTTTTFVSSSNGGELLGAGIEYAFPGTSWTAKLEYDYVLMANRKFVVSVPNMVTVSPNLQILKVGMNFRM
jgi:outer membrane immunogenic protein